MNSSNNYESGTVEIAIGTGLITSDRLGETVVNFTEGTRSGEPLSGNVTLPSRRYDERTITFPLFIRGVDELKDLWPEAYNAAAGASAGNISPSTGNCSIPLSIINIHPVCNRDSRADFHTKGTVSITWDPTYNSSDLLTTEVTIYCQDLSAGVPFVYGSGDLTQDTLWDAATQQYVPVASS